MVMIPGGGWRSAVPTGLEPLAAALARQGVVAIPVVIRTAGDGVTYPVPVEDVLCALADGAATARAAGIQPTTLVLLGHSSGAHLSAVATLAPGQRDAALRGPARGTRRARRARRPLRHPHLRRRGVDLFAPDADAATRTPRTRCCWPPTAPTCPCSSCTAPPTSGCR